jgi:hypothetical protein
MSLTLGRISGYDVEGKRRFLSQNPALRLSGRTGFPHGRIFLQEHYKL